MYTNTEISASVLALACVCTYQAVHSTQGVVGVVEGVGQLVHAIVGLAVAVETHAHRDAVER